MTAKTYTPDSSIGQRLAEVQRLKLEIDRLNEQLDEHKAYLLGHAIRNDYGTLRLQGQPVTLQRKGRTTWTYSEALTRREAAIKAAKQREQQDGTARATVAEYAAVTFSVKASNLAAALASATR
jgi:hypothetical protein